MKPFPHEYSVRAVAENDGPVRLASHDLPQLESAAPVEFDGPGDRWSPEELLLAAVVDCFVLTFRAVARASKLPWESIDARVDGVLTRVDRVTRFSEFRLEVELRVAGPDVVDETALRALEKAERGCLITNSLTAPLQLDARVVR